MLGWLRRRSRRREATYLPLSLSTTTYTGPGAVVIHSPGMSDGYDPPSGSLAPPVDPGNGENMSIGELKNRFRYHPPQTEQRRQAHETVRSGLLTTAERLYELLPDGREKSLAITKLEEAMFWANAALARTPDAGEG